MSRRSVRNRMLGAAVHAALVVALPGTAAASTLDFEPYVGAALGYVDNIELNPEFSSNGQPLPQTSDGVIELEAGFNSRYTSQRLLGGLNYRFRYLDYFDEDDFDSDLHNLGASGRVIAVQELLHVDGSAFYQQQLKDPSGSPGFGNFFNSGDLRDAWGWNLMPVVTHDFGYATAYASYRYGRVYYTEDRIDGVSDDSTNRDLQASLATSNPNQPLTWRVFYLSSRTDYVDFDPYRYDQAGAELGWAVGKDFRLVGEYGLESDLTENVQEGGLESSYWNAGVIYEPNDRNRLEARAGERFFGDTYEFRLRHVARLAEFNLSYTEQPTTNSSRLGTPTERPPDEVPPFPDVPGFQDTRTEAFLLKRWYAALKIDGSRTVVDFSWYDDEQTYFEPQEGRQVNSRAGQIAVTRELGPRSNVRLWWARRDWGEDPYEISPGQTVPGSDTEDQILALRFTRDVGRGLALSAETALQWRTEQDEDRANGWWVGLRARKTF
jgi:hypothetical protein